MAEQEEKQPEAEESTEQGQDPKQDTTPPADVPEELVGVGILVIGYTQEQAADETLKGMQQAKKQGEFYFENAAVVRQDAKGKVSIRESEDMSSGKGAGIGAVVGGILGLLGGPAGVVVGAGVGAGVGGALAHHDAGFRNEGLEDVGSALRPSTSALVITTSKAFIEQVRKQVPAAELADVSRRIAQEISDSLAEGKDMALGLLFTNQGIGIKQIRVDDESAEIYGLVITDDAVAVGAAVVTEAGAVVEGAVATADEVVEGAAVILPEEETHAGELADASEEGVESEEKPDKPA
ncbi:MAG: DUF1269 domain-containing protein [Caldilineaceae bacterium]|jgi:uncharacterized membrane protein